MSAVPWILGNLVSPTVCREKKSCDSNACKDCGFYVFQFYVFPNDKYLDNIPWAKVCKEIFKWICNIL